MFVQLCIILVVLYLCVLVVRCTKWINETYLLCTHITCICKVDRCEVTKILTTTTARLIHTLLIWLKRILNFIESRYIYYILFLNIMHRVILHGNLKNFNRGMRHVTYYFVMQSHLFGVGGGGGGRRWVRGICEDKVWSIKIARYKFTAYRKLDIELNFTACTFMMPFARRN